MAFKSRSRLKSTIDAISAQLGPKKASTVSGVGDLLDASVNEVQLVDENIKYFPVITASPFIVPLQQLIAGVNIFGVRTAGAMTIRIPLRAKEEQAITIVDERGTADVDPITIEVA